MTLPRPVSHIDEGPSLPPPEGDALGARMAASVMLLRDGPTGMEVLLLRRAERTGDLRSGVWVFPGGVLDPVDGRLGAYVNGPGDAFWSQRLGLPKGGQRYLVAALRECFEEVGVLLAANESVGQSAQLEQALAERAICVTGEDFAALCQRHALVLDAQAMLYHSHWLTPPGVPKRFDTRFFVARMPEGQQPVADEGEALELAWMTPAAALAPAAKLKLLPVTRRTLMDLGSFADVQACLDDAAARQYFPRHMPRMGVNAGGVIRPVLPDEWAYAEIAKLDPQGRADVCYELPPLRPVALSANVTRLTCANGSVMTGPGTNTYVLRAPGSDEVAVLDPGPDDSHTAPHLQALLEMAATLRDGQPGRITRILTTHTHKDHSPAAVRLKALTGAQVIGVRPRHPEWQDSSFQPDREPVDGERISLGEGLTLRAVATPGHASNHICWLLEEERLLFTGDHVMQGSTVVINPPDGDMAAYFASLEALLAVDLEWFAPGHGFLMAQPHDEVRRLLAHRRQREAKVLAALQAALAGPEKPSLEALVPQVYGDVPSSRYGIAARSLLAHWLKLAQEGQVPAP